MSGSTVAPGRVSDGRSKVWFVPKGIIQDRKNVQKSELENPQAIDATYALFGDGFDHQTEVTKFQTTRYTLAQILENEGQEKDSFVLKYPYVGNATDELRTKLTRHSEWDVVERLAVENEEDLEDGQLLSIVAPVRCGLQREIPRTANTEIGKIQDLLVTGKVERDVVVGGAGSLAWTIEVTGTPTGGTYSLTVNGFETAPIAYNANAAAIKSAIDGLSGVTGITVTASGTGTIALTFSGKVTLTADGTGLTGGTSPAVVVTAA